MSAKPTYKPRSRLSTALSAVKARVYSHRRKAATVVAGALALAMGYHVVFGRNGLTAYEHKRQDAQSLQVQMHDLQLENERLRGHVDRLQTDPGAIEHQAREELHYTRAGEVIYTLALDPTPTPHSAALPPAQP